MHFVNAKGILSPQNGMNLYRGCTHGCIYCDSRSRCYHMDHDFECFLQALFPQKCRLNSSKLHGEFPHYCISSAGTLSGAGEEPLQAYKVY